MNNPDWVVKSVTANPDYTLTLRFENGEVRSFNAEPLLKKPLYHALKSPDVFRKARVYCGTVIWDDEIDIAPEYLYAQSTPKI